MPTYVVEDWLEPTQMTWPDRDAGPWAVTLWWRAAPGKDDRVECSGIALQPHADARTEPISATLVRQLPVARIIAEGRRVKFEEVGGSLLEAIDDGLVSDVSEGFVRGLRQESAPWSERRVGRPAYWSDDHYRSVALTYTAAHAAGQSPLLAVQEHWTVSRPTASRWVATARAKGLLPTTARGKAKGNPELLHQDGDHQ